LGGAAVVFVSEVFVSGVFVSGVEARFKMLIVEACIVDWALTGTASGVKKNNAVPMILNKKRFLKTFIAKSNPSKGLSASMRSH
jgi:hypothetical protein